jgi:Rad3-related DNA helicase
MINHVNEFKNSNNNNMPNPHNILVMFDYFHSDISSGFDQPNLIDGVVVLGSPFPNPQDVQTNIDRSFINYYIGNNNNNNNFYSMQYAMDNITQYCGRMQRCLYNDQPQ